MLLLSQRDVRWAQTKLGKSTLTVGRFGCTTTCISMLSDYFKFWTAPNRIAQQKEWYTKDGLVLWNKLSFSNFRYDMRYKGRDDKTILACIKDTNRAVILEVDNGQHWVVALHKTLFKNDYVVADPWYGDKRTACGTYKNITGFATFIKN